ncbi:MAG: flavin reductase family protein [Armatimonadetes bacterium]|nr:flavin reductase family protein [Armatimonadota bacterium]
MHLTIDQIPRHVGGKIWAALIAPRPIALITTRDENGTPNIAPYNAFCGLANHPPMLGVSFSRRGGGPKNTLANIQATRVFVVNLVPRFLAEIMNKSAEGAEREDDFARLGLTRANAGSVDCPRVAESPAALECKVAAIHPLPPSQCELVVGEIVGVHIRDEYVVNDQGFDPMAADLLASVGAEDYLSLNGETLFLPRTWG